MASKDYLAARHYAAEDMVGRVESDGPKAFRIREIHGGASTPTVVLSLTSSLLTLTDSDAAATAIDLSAAAYNTIGEVVDYINSLTSWECKILDSLRADASDNVLVDGSVASSTSENGETVFDVPVDTSATFSLTYRCAYNRDFDTIKRFAAAPATGSALFETVVKGSHRVNLSKILYYANVGTDASANSVRIYSYDPATQTETQIWGAKSVDVTATTITFTDPLTAGDGKELIVRVLDAASLADAGAYLEVEYSKE
jgi:hypothetical protein